MHFVKGLSVMFNAFSCFDVVRGYTVLSAQGRTTRAIKASDAHLPALPFRDAVVRYA